MTSPPASGPRALLAAVLIVVLAFAGAGRGIAAEAEKTIVGAALPGVRIPICHAGVLGSRPADPTRPAGHDCCDACILLASAVLPAASILHHPVPSTVPMAFVRPGVPAIRTARSRSPRQSRGPPATSSSRDLA